MLFAHLVSVGSLLVSYARRDMMTAQQGPHRHPSIPWARSGLPLLDSHIGLGDQKVPRNPREFPWKATRAQAVQVTR